MKCQLADLAVNYEIFGEGKPLVAISGIPSDHQIILSWLEPIFAARPGWQRIYFDLPGTGLTSAGGITMNPNIRSGKPTIRGLGYTVYDILSCLATSMMVAEILDDFLSSELAESSVRTRYIGSIQWFASKSMHNQA